MDVHGRDLRYFVTVAEELHFTRAAERLYISQPSLSKQIRMLERALGTALFDRAGGNVQLTASGSALLPPAKRVLAEWDGALAALEQVRETRSSTLVVGMSTSPGRGGLLRAIRSRFREQHPAASITLRQVSWDDSTAGLAEGSSDVAYVWLPLPHPGRYRWVVLFEEPCLVALSDRNPLAARHTIEFSELMDEPFLALPVSAGPLRDYWLGISHRNGKPPVIGGEISSVDETYESLVDGRGVCLLAAGNAASLTRGGVVTRPVRGIPPSRLAIAWRKDQHHPLVPAYTECAQRAVTATTR